MKLRLILVAAGVLAIAALVWWQRHEEAADLRALAEIQRSGMPGWFAGHRARVGWLRDAVPALEHELDEARKVGAHVVTVTRTVTVEVPFYIPAAGAGEPTPPQPGTDVTVSADVQTAVAALEDGRIEWTSRVFATLRSGTWTETKALPVQSSTTGVDPVLEKALRAYLHPVTRYDLHVGASIGLDGIGVAASVSGVRRRIGWWAGGDYVLASPDRSRVMGGAAIRF